MKSSKRRRRRLLERYDSDEAFRKDVNAFIKREKKKPTGSWGLIHSGMADDCGAYDPNNEDGTPKKPDVIVVIKRDGNTTVTSWPDDGFDVSGHRFDSGIMQTITMRKDF